MVVLVLALTLFVELRLPSTAATVMVFFFFSFSSPSHPCQSLVSMMSKPYSSKQPNRVAPPPPPPRVATAVLTMLGRHAKNVLMTTSLMRSHATLKSHVGSMKADGGRRWPLMVDGDDEEDDDAVVVRTLLVLLLETLLLRFAAVAFELDRL